MTSQKNQWSSSESSLFHQTKDQTQSLSPADRFFHEQLFPVLKNHKTRSLLTIGPGPGQLENLLASELGFSLGFIEPDQSFFEEFQKQAKTQSLDQFNGSFEDFSSSQKYDCVLAINSWYYLGLSEEALSKALDLLNPKGRLLIVLVSEDSFGNKVQKDFREKPQYIMAEELLSWLKGLNLEKKFSFEKWHRPCAASDYIVNGELTDFGKKWASFIIGEEFDSLDSEKQEAIQNRLSSLIENATLTYVYGCLVVEK